MNRRLVILGCLVIVVSTRPPFPFHADGPADNHPGFDPPNPQAVGIEVSPQPIGQEL